MGGTIRSTVLGPTIVAKYASYSQHLAVSGGRLIGSGDGMWVPAAGRAKTPFTFSRSSRAAPHTSTTFPAQRAAQKNFFFATYYAAYSAAVSAAASPETGRGDAGGGRWITWPSHWK